jgi:hypothetical protein
MPRLLVAGRNQLHAATEYVRELKVPHKHSSVPSIDPERTNELKSLLSKTARRIFDGR